jgi:single-strand DNA-binding protein
MGNLTRDPELRYTPKGTACGRITIAINRKFKTEAGEARDEVTFVDVDAFAKTAETVAKYFKKGQLILIEGRLKLDQWEDKASNQKMSKLRVVMEQFSFTGSTQEPESGESRPQEDRGPTPAVKPPWSTPNTAKDDDDRVPF